MPGTVIEDKNYLGSKRNKKTDFDIFYNLIDSNHDGLIQKSEWTQFNDLFLRTFIIFDIDRNYTLNQRELEKMLIASRWFRSLLTM